MKKFIFVLSTIFYAGLLGVGERLERQTSTAVKADDVRIEDGVRRRVFKQPGTIELKNYAHIPYAIQILDENDKPLLARAGTDEPYILQASEATDDSFFVENDLLGYFRVYLPSYIDKKLTILLYRAADLSDEAKICIKNGVIDGMACKVLLAGEFEINPNSDRERVLVSIEPTDLGDTALRARPQSSAFMGLSDETVSGIPIENNVKEDEIIQSFN